MRLTILAAVLALVFAMPAEAKKKDKGFAVSNPRTLTTTQPKFGIVGGKLKFKCSGKNCVKG